MEGDGGSESEAGPAPHTSCEEEEEGGAQGDQAEEKEGDKEEDKGMVKPPYSYAQLIVQALLAPKDRRQTLSGIYNFIAEKYPFYKLEDKGWKVVGDGGSVGVLLLLLCTISAELHSTQPLPQPVLYEGSTGERGPWIWKRWLLVYAP